MTNVTKRMTPNVVDAAIVKTGMTLVRAGWAGGGPDATCGCVEAVVACSLNPELLAQVRESLATQYDATTEVYMVGGAISELIQRTLIDNGYTLDYIGPLFGNYDHFGSTANGVEAGAIEVETPVDQFLSDDRLLALLDARDVFESFYPPKMEQAVEWLIKRS